jgi:hypothetical protein
MNFMNTTVTAQYLSYHRKKEVDSLSRLAEQLQSGQVAVTGASPILREAEKQFRLLGKAADLRSL